ncbi:MAG: tetratricopeptide repeat protein [Acidiferrobacterales bacterium]
MTELDEALEHHRAGRLQEAEALYRRVLAREPDHADALHLLGVIAHQVGQHENAVALIEQAVARNPDSPEYHNGLGEALHALGQHDRALDAYGRACTLNPRYADAHCNRGIALHAQGKLTDAVSAFEKAAAVSPDSAEAHYNLANVLHEVGEFERAVAAYQVAIQRSPNDPDIYNNLGVALADQLKLNDAFAAFDQSLALQPDFAQAHSNKGMALLLTGRFEEGWREYAWRMPWVEYKHIRTVRWDGQAFAGKTLLVHTEQGIGDSIQFCRYLPMVKTRGGRVLLACQPAMQRLLQGLPGVDAWVGDPKTLSADVVFDFYCPLLNIPGLFDTKLESIPAEVPYLRVDPGLIATWKQRIDPQRYNVGLCWAGRPTNRNDQNRSTTLAAFAPLARANGVVFYSLQKGVATEQAAHPPAGMTFVDITSELNDFADTAALIANLDLVIAVDTAVAHLAGALAKPVWVVLTYCADWRWLLDREDSPWYPTMRLFRQPHPGDWDAPMQRVAGELVRATSRAR